MAKKLQDPGIDIPFPVKGLHLIAPISQQPPATTIDAENVRAFDPRTDRNRGAQRSGIEKFCPEQLAAASGQEIFQATLLSGQAYPWGSGDAYVPNTTGGYFDIMDLTDNPVADSRLFRFPQTPRHATFSPGRNLYTVPANNQGFVPQRFGGAFGGQVGGGVAPGGFGGGFGGGKIAGGGFGGGFAAGGRGNVGQAGVGGWGVANPMPQVEALGVANGIAVAELRISNKPIKSTEKLIVCVARHSGIDLTFTATFDGNAMTVNATGDNGAFRTSIISYTPAADTTGDIVVTFASASGLMAIAASRITKLPVNAIDVTASATGSSTTPSSGATAATANSTEMVIGAVGTRGPLADTAGDWTLLFADQRDGTANGGGNANATISTSFHGQFATSAWTAAKTGITSRDWVALCATYK